ncbi:hypothetical protein [Streptomyces atratus]|uniref:hypothetical protein n=1 Tax=Streptomyces atratus TaxID=1893 RepID=UPI00366634F1
MTTSRPDTDAAPRETALGLLLQRVHGTASAVGDRFPLYADPADGRWTTTRRGSWTGGFWAGLLRLATAQEPAGSALQDLARDTAV